jgi:hypothetical protein
MVKKLNGHFIVFSLSILEHSSSSFFRLGFLVQRPNPEEGRHWHWPLRLQSGTLPVPPQ